MQEFALYSQIHATRYNQILQILAGVTASKPTKVCEQDLVYQQLKLAPTPSRKGHDTQAQRLSHHHLIRDVEGSDKPWRLRVEEVPEAGVKGVIFQSVSERLPIQTELDRFRTGEWYKLVSSFIRTGTRFVNGNVVIQIFRIYKIDKTSTGTSLDELSSTEQGKLLDPSGAYVIKAFVRTEDGVDSSVRDRAREELLRFAETVKGAIDLYAPDRLALDPRVKLR